MDMSLLKNAHAAAYRAGDKVAQEKLAWAISFAMAGDREWAQAVYDEVVAEEA